MDKVLKDFCECHINNKAGNAFVGIKYASDKVHIYFPVCFRFQNKDDDNALREDIYLLLKTISRHGDQQESKNAESIFSLADNDILAPYIYILRDYFNRGYYVERETIYTSNGQGRINWNRTIKMSRPYLQEDNAYYLNFVTKKDVVNDNELITKVHKYCVHRAFEVIGWLFTSQIPPKPSFMYNRTIDDFKDLFISVVKRKLANTFQDSKKILFAQMLSILTEESNGKVISNGAKIGVKSFEYCWEHMVNTVFGNLEDRLVNKLKPTCYWHFDDNDTFRSDYMNSKLIPDTIMSCEERTGAVKDAYVLDAKYYSYGDTENVFHSLYLPKSADINKQVTYGEYVASQIKEAAQNSRFGNLVKREFSANSKVYNAFILPGNIENTSLFRDGRQEKYYRNFGYAEASWKNNGVEYEKIQGVLVDTRFMMEISTSVSTSEIKKLARVIREGLNRKPKS